MSLENYQILIKKYRYDSDTLAKDINLFSTADKTLESTFDLTPYLCGDEGIEIESAFVKVEKARVYTQNRQSSNIDLSIDDIDEDMREFFEIYEDTTFLKYLCEVWKLDTNEIIFTGIIHQDSISELLENTSNYTDLEIIKLTVAAYDKEFKEYYSQKKLKQCYQAIDKADEIAWQYDYNIKPKWYKYRKVWNSTFGWTWVLDKHFEYIKYNTLREILLQNFETFSSDNLILDDVINSYRVFRDSFLFSGLFYNRNYLFSKCGYQRISETMENVWGFLNKLCNAMGWDFYFKNGKLNICNRFKIRITTEDLSVNLFTDIEISKDKAEDSFKHIYIWNGEIQHGWSGQGGYYREMTGNRQILISDISNINNSNHFDSINNNALPMNKLQASHGLKFEQVYGADDFGFTIRVFRQEGNQGYLNWDYSETYWLDKKETLEIDCGDTGDFNMLYNIDEEYNFYYQKSWNLAKQPYEFNFRGNYGNCLFIKKSDTNYFTYDDYVKTDTLTNNFLFLTKSIASVLRLKGKIDETKHTFADRINLIDDEKLNGEYVVEKFKTDIENEKTGLEMIKL